MGWDIKIPGVLDQAHAAFDDATAIGKYLWPSQRESYCAGYWTAYDKLQAENARLREAILEWCARPTKDGAKKLREMVEGGGGE